MKGLIHSIETLGLLDGPGVRIVFFLQGCDKRCVFCHNPDTWNLNSKNEMTSDEILKFVSRYENYFEIDGGVTFSGGEPLVQKAFLVETLRKLKNAGIHTCIDTSGMDNCAEVLKYTDLVIFDIKALTPQKYKELVGVDIEASLQFLAECQKQEKELWIRQVIIPSINDNEEYIYELAEFIKKIKNVTKVELLPYHTKGLEKYEKMGIKSKIENIPEMDKNKCRQLNNLLNDLITNS